MERFWNEETPMICSNQLLEGGQREGVAPVRKALLLNLDKTVFGTFAEIGAGQEVARHFFRVGGAADTIAKTISAYDMTFSDEIYGKATRYVSRDRLNAMLTHEYKLLLERLSVKRGADTTFFAFANTVATKGFKGNRESHGWLGIRYQAEPLAAPNDIALHVRMTDSDSLLQQEALGIVGVNLIFAAFHLGGDFKSIVASLLDGLSTARIEIDMLEVSGPLFNAVDNRLVSIELLKQGLTPAIVLPPDGSVQQPSEILYQRTLIVERGRFQPVTYLHVDMIDQARSFVAAQGNQADNPLLLCEITLHNPASLAQLNEHQMLAHAEELAALGYTVTISVFSEFHKLVSFFRRYTEKSLYFVAGVDTLVKLHDDKYYSDLEGGMLEAMGRFFRANVNLLLYPMLRERFLGLLERARVTYPAESINKLPAVVTSTDVQVDPRYGTLLLYLKETGCISDVAHSRPEILTIDTAAVLRQIRANDSAWLAAVPPSAAAIIEKHANVYAENGAPPAGPGGPFGHGGIPPKQGAHPSPDLSRGSPAKADKS